VSSDIYLGAKNICLAFQNAYRRSHGISVVVGVKFAWGRRQKASARADGATNLPCNFFTLKFEEKRVLVTWPNWWHHDVALPWFFVVHILVLWKNNVSMSKRHLCHNFGMKIVKVKNLGENVFGHVTNLMVPGRSPLMGHYRPYFCFSKKSIFLVVRWVNKWAWPNNKQTNKRESEAAQTDDIVTSWTVCDVGLIDNGPAPVSLTMWKRGSSSTSNNVTSIMLQDMFIS